MGKVLITGGAGFIGSNLAIKLLSLGHEVTVLDNLSKQIHGNNPENDSVTYNKINGELNFIKGTVEDDEDVKKSISDNQFIIHLASETGTGQSMYSIKNYNYVNVGGTSVILDFLANNSNKVEKIIVASSRSLYGEGKYFCKDHGIVFPKSRESTNLNIGDFNCKCPICGKNVENLPTDEESKPSPASVYAITKYCQENLIINVTSSLDIPFVSLRFQNVYGPGQSLSNPYTGIISIFSNLINTNKPINIFEDGNESRDFVYIDDVVNSLVLSLENTNANNKVFNVGSGVRTSVTEVAKKLYNNFAKEQNYYISGNYRLGDIRHNHADISLIKKELNFSPKYSFEQGLSQFCDWVKNQKIINNGYEKSIIEMKKRNFFK